MLEHIVTMELIAKAQQGDQEAKTTLIKENMPLLKSIVRRYTQKGVDYDDLIQISSIGLLKAIANFSLSYNVRFSTYAVPMVMGEVKRFMRDDGYIKVSRSVKSLAGKINRFTEAYRSTHNDEPTIDVLAEHFNVEPSEIVFAMDAVKMPISLYEKTGNTDGKQQHLIDKISSSTGNRDEELIDRVILHTVIGQLSEREKKVILLRYFRDMTQGEIAKMLGVSQVQISRLENKIIEKIKKKFES